MTTASERGAERARKIAGLVANNHDAALVEYAVERAFAAIRAEERERCADKIDGLMSDLDDAIETAFLRGAIEWTRLNYPKHYERLRGRFIDREAGGDRSAAAIRGGDDGG